MSTQGIVFNIQRFTIHDGPGLRTEIFLKGCPLRCRWCSNPEGQKTYVEPGVYGSKCVSRKICGDCAEACPEDAIIFYRGKLTSIDREKCSNCLGCYDACPSDAIKVWGKVMSAEECMKIIRKDRGYYERSDGGVTISGGDPLVQSDFTASLLKACKEEGIHTCCESTLFADWSEIEKVLPYTDLFITDIKHMDSAAHEKYTGVSNTLILENIKRLASEGRDMIIRIPVVPTVNNDIKNIAATADFILNELGGKVRTLQLLSFMRLGEEKYKSLGLPYPMTDLKFNRRAFQKSIEALADYFNSRGIHCLVGTREKE